MTTATTITIDGQDYEIQRDYPLQRAWCYSLGSHPSYSSGQREQMRESGAPQNAIYEQYPQTVPPTWGLLDEGTHPATRKRTVATAVKLGHLTPIEAS